MAAAAQKLIHDAGPELAARAADPDLHVMALPTHRDADARIRF
jgi:hypothetical protein